MIYKTQAGRFKRTLDQKENDIKTSSDARNPSSLLRCFSFQNEKILSHIYFVDYIHRPFVRMIDCPYYMQSTAALFICFDVSHFTHSLHKTRRLITVIVDKHPVRESFGICKTMFGVKVSRALYLSLMNDT